VLTLGLPPMFSNAYYFNSFILFGYVRKTNEHLERLLLSHPLCSSSALSNYDYKWCFFLLIFIVDKNMKLDIFVNESKSIPNNIVGMYCVEEVLFMIPDSIPIPSSKRLVPTFWFSY
jgi:hypothetical protein